jgi:hypothetical protein
MTGSSPPLPLHSLPPGRFTSNWAFIRSCDIQNHVIFYPSAVLCSESHFPSLRPRSPFIVCWPCAAIDGIVQRLTHCATALIHLIQQHLVYTTSGMYSYLDRCMIHDTHSCCVSVRALRCKMTNVGTGLPHTQIPRPLSQPTIPSCTPPHSLNHSHLHGHQESLPTMISPRSVSSQTFMHKRPCLSNSNGSHPHSAPHLRCLR